MNIYRFSFCAKCPADGDAITYRAEIETREMIRVERINEWREKAKEGFHETFAEDLLKAFGGQQRIVATHQGVQIETVRPCPVVPVKIAEAMASIRSLAALPVVRDAATALDAREQAVAEAREVVAEAIFQVAKKRSLPLPGSYYREDDTIATISPGRRKQFYEEADAVVAALASRHAAPGERVPDGQTFTVGEEVKVGRQTKRRITMTLDLTEKEIEELNALAKRRDLEKPTVFRQAFRLYQWADVTGWEIPKSGMLAAAPAPRDGEAGK